MSAPTPSWTPSEDYIASTLIDEFRRGVESQFDLELPDYEALHAWSIQDDRFWSALWDFVGVVGIHGDGPVLADDSMPGAQWFPGVQLNYARQVFERPGADDDAPILIERAEPGGAEPREFTLGDLKRDVAALAHTLREQGVSEGDRVAGYLPNIAETVVAFLATASLGAIWSACGQDYAAVAAVDRLGQLEPVALIAADGYRYASKVHDRLTHIAEIRSAMPSIRTTIVVPRRGASAEEREAAGLGDALTWEQATTGDHDLEITDVAFDHPLWVLFSSGTTGKPKGIVHGHGGVILEHVKQMTLHSDLRAGDVFFWYTSPSWMMWNYQMAGLLIGATIVCYDGSPSHPTKDHLWQLAAELDVKLLGTSPAYMAASEKAELHPGRDHDLSTLKFLGSTGSVLPPAANDWVSREVGDHIAVAGISGGTDVVSAFIGFVPTLPVYPGELSCICLGTAMEAWAADGTSVLGEMGELVITKPMPSMPVFFWNDADGSRYAEAYFDLFPGVWRHGDWVTVTDRGSVVVHGRSDSTLNRNGIRMGSADIYAAIEGLSEIADSLVIGVEKDDGTYWMPLFVQLAEGEELSDDLQGRIKARIREQASPRHVPDDILAVSGIPHTRTGKKLEVPIKRILGGADPASVADPSSIDNADLLTEFERLRQS